MNSNVKPDAPRWPWADLLRLLVWFGVPVLLCVPPWLILRHGQDQLDAEHALLIQEIKLIDVKLKTIDDIDRETSRLLQRKQIIEQLEAVQARTGDLLTALGRLPSGIQLLKVTSEQRDVTLDALSSDPALSSAAAAVLIESGLRDVHIVSRQRQTDGNRERIDVRAQVRRIGYEDDDSASDGLPPAAAAPRP